MKLMMIMTLMANKLPVVTHQLVSQSALKSEEEVGPSNVKTIIKKARIFVPLGMIDQWIPLHSALSKLYIDVVEIICYFCLVCFFVVWSYNTSKAGKSSILMMYTASPLPQLCKCQHSFSLELWMNDKHFRFMSYTSFVLLLDFHFKTDGYYFVTTVNRRIFALSSVK